MHIDVNFYESRRLFNSKGTVNNLNVKKKTHHILFGCTSEYLSILFWCCLLFLIHYLEQGHIWLDQCPLIQHNVSSSRSTTGLGESERKEKKTQKFFSSDKKVMQKGHLWREDSFVSNFQVM